MAETVVDRLEMVEVEDQHRYRTAGVRLTLYHPRRRLRKTTAIEHAGQRVRRRRRLVRGYHALRHQHEDDEYGGDGIKHELDGEHRHPDAAGESIVVRPQQAAKQE